MQRLRRWDDALGAVLVERGTRQVVRWYRLEKLESALTSNLIDPQERRGRKKGALGPDANASERAVFLVHLNGCRYRKLSNELTLEDFSKLSGQPCGYCGAMPRAQKVSGRYVILRNGIDRIDNELGYLYNNVVACCTICNYMKRKLTLLEFTNHVARIYKHFALPNGF